MTDGGRTRPAARGEPLLTAARPLSRHHAKTMAPLTYISRRLPGSWRVNCVKNVGSLRPTEMVAASKDVRGSRLPTHVEPDMFNAPIKRGQLWTIESGSPPRGGRTHASICHLSSVISSPLTPSTSCRSILRFGRTRFGLGH
jgi:hypothetical protein